jgi:hypothetical protein
MSKQRRYKVWGEFPARKTPQYFFAKSKEDYINKEDSGDYVSNRKRKLM